MQVVFFLRTSPSWPQCAPSPASSPSCCPFTTSREYNSWVWKWDAHLSSSMRIRLASQPRRTILCSVLSTLLTESTSNVMHVTYSNTPTDTLRFTVEADPEGMGVGACREGSKVIAGDWESGLTMLDGAKEHTKCNPTALKTCPYYLGHIYLEN